jgi:hypothetical protein
LTGRRCTVYEKSGLGVAGRLIFFVKNAPQSHQVAYLSRYIHHSKPL